MREDGTWREGEDRQIQPHPSALKRLLEQAEGRSYWPHSEYPVGMTPEQTKLLQTALEREELNSGLWMARYQVSELGERLERQRA